MNAPTMQSRLLDAYYVAAAMGRDGLTAEEAAYFAGFDRVDGAWKRVSELKALGAVEPTGDCRVGVHSRRPAAVLRLAGRWSS